VDSAEFAVLLLSDRKKALRIFFEAWLDANESETDTVEALACMAMSNDMPLITLGQDICRQFDKLVGNP
jgi:hypothetical protein